MKIVDAFVDAFTVGQAIIRFTTDPVEIQGFRFVVRRGFGRGKDPGLSGSEKLGQTRSKDFLDRTVVDLGLLRQIRYWIEVHRDENGVDILERTDGPFFPGQQIPVPAVEMIRRLDIYLKHGGTVIAVYALQTTKKRCSVCWDHIKQAPKLTHCLECFGTGIQAGFSDPFVIRAMLNPPSATNTPTISGEVETIGNQILVASLPKIQPKDVIRTIDGRAWRVVNVTPTEYKQVLVQQFVTISALEKSDPVYKLEVPDEVKNYDSRIEPNRSVVQQAV